jgi:hypothetical protein
MAQLESGLVGEVDEELRPLLDRDRFLVWPYLINALQRSGKTDEAVQEARLLCERTKKILRRSLQRTYYDSCIVLADLLRDRGDFAEAEDVYTALLDLTKNRKVAGIGFADLQAARTDLFLAMRRTWINGSELSDELRSRLNTVRQLSGQVVDQTG